MSCLAATRHAVLLLTPRTERKTMCMAAVAQGSLPRLWVDHTRRMASGVPMPAARGSPAGPNQWFCGAPAVTHEEVARVPGLGPSATSSKESMPV